MTLRACIVLVSITACPYSPTGGDPTSASSESSAGEPLSTTDSTVTTISTTDPTTSTASTGATPTMGSTGSGSTGNTTGEPPPDAPVFTLGFSQVKQFDFSWTAVTGASYYRLKQRADGAVDYDVIESNIVGESISLTMPLHFRYDASYILQACNNDDVCTDSAPVDVVDSLATAVGYFKASNTGGDDWFGSRVAVSADGNTLAIGAFHEDSAATGIDGNQADSSAPDAGAVYVFIRSNNSWSQQAYIKASNTDAGDSFGFSVAVSADGNTLAVGAIFEDSAATGIDGDAADNSAGDAGAVHVFVRSSDVWSQQAYLKASNTGVFDLFGYSVALSADGNTLAACASQEDSAATGVDGNQANDAAMDSGAMYVFVRSNNEWSQQAYIKASNTDNPDHLGEQIAVSADGNTLAVNAIYEDSAATGVGGNQANNSAVDSGAVYVYLRSNNAWAQQAYIKASNTGAGDFFGSGLAVSADGNTLAVGAIREDSAATGIGGNQADNGAQDAGAAYVFVRSNNAWSQQAYIKSSNAGADDRFGNSGVALSGDGNTLAVCAALEDSDATGISGNPDDNSANNAGAAYVFVRSNNVWSQRTYVKASNTAGDDTFGSVAMSADGNTLAIGAIYEDSAAIGIDGDQANNSAQDAGAVYLF